MRRSAGTDRRRPFRRYAFFIVAIAAMVPLSQAALSIAIDPFGVFGLTGFNQRNFEPNLRYLKIEHLKSNRYEGFVLGTSRVNAYRTALLGELTDRSFYNLAAPSDSAVGMERKLRWLIASGQPVRDLFISLDVDEFDSVPVAAKDSRGVYRDHPDLLGISWLSFSLDYLLLDVEILSIAIYSNVIKRDTWYDWDIATGHYYLPLYDRQIKANPEAYAAAKFSRQDEVRDLRTHPGQLAAFRNIIALARQHDIRTTVVIYPYNRWLARTFSWEGFDAWYREIVAIAGTVWDFSGRNSVTTNDAIYYEESHATFAAGDLAIRRIFDPDHASLRDHPRFGVRVTPATVDARLKQLKAELATIRRETRS